MRQKIYDFLRRLYGAVMLFAFLGGVVPLVPFIIALIIGGETGEAISVWLYKEYYPFVILSASIALLIGLAGMYIAGQHGLSAGDPATTTHKD